MNWRVAATIKCGVIVDMGEAQAPSGRSRRHRYIEGVRFERPRSVEGWRGGLASEYDVEVRLNAASAEEAHRAGLSCLGEVVGALSFLGSAPAEIVKMAVTDSPGGIMKLQLIDSPGKMLDVRLTDSAGAPEPGHEYTSILYPELSKADLPRTKLPAGHTGFLSERKPERVVRALRWIQKSHLTDSPVDEFTCLMIAFESVSHLLKAPGVQHWHCRSCSRDVVTCPSCGASTESKKSGETAMREFVASLGWGRNEWKTSWGWRCKLLHGEADISIDEEHAIRERLPKLEEAVIVAVKRLAGLPDDHSPKHVRHRLPFSDPRLEVKWRV